VETSDYFALLSLAIAFASLYVSVYLERFRGPDLHLDSGRMLPVWC
jgi:hypothetical protein